MHTAASACTQAAAHPDAPGTEREWDLAVHQGQGMGRKDWGTDPEVGVQAEPVRILVPGIELIDAFESVEVVVGRAARRRSLLEPASWCSGIFCSGGGS